MTCSDSRNRGLKLLCEPSRLQTDIAIEIEIEIEIRLDFSLDWRLL